MSGMNSPPRSGPNPAIPLFAVVLSSLAALLAAMSLRLSPGEQAFAWPWFGATPPINLALIIATSGAGVLAAIAWRHAPHQAWRNALVVCLAWPAVPLSIAWLILPAAGAPSLLVKVAAPALGLVAWLLLRHRPARPEHPPQPRSPWIVLHGIAVAGLVIVGIWGSGFDDPRAFWLSLAIYPVYALVQLFLVLAVLWTRLRLLAGGRTAPAVATVSFLFALVHWPNPALVLLAGMGMTLWAVAYARGRGLVILALSMGLLATLAGQGLPDHWTDHMRSGPRFVRQRAVPRLAAAANRRTQHLPAGRDRTTAFLADLYPSLTGREASPAELDRWWRSLVPCRRSALAWSFFYSDEYNRKFAAPAGQEPLPDYTHWTRLPAPWPERIGTFTSHEPGLSTETWREFLARCYREILRRNATAGELAGWSEDLSQQQRRHLAQVLLEHRRNFNAAPFDTIDCATLRLGR